MNSQSNHRYAQNTTGIAVRSRCLPGRDTLGRSVHGRIFLNASGLESLAPLKEVWGHLESENSEILGQIFKLLNPQAIPTLVSLLPQTPPGSFC